MRFHQIFLDVTVNFFGLYSSEWWSYLHFEFDLPQNVCCCFRNNVRVEISRNIYHSVWMTETRQACFESSNQTTHMVHNTTGPMFWSKQVDQVLKLRIDLWGWRACNKFNFLFVKIRFRFVLSRVECASGRECKLVVELFSTPCLI